ncbi:hypothetical protein DFQ26_004439 [Actinomortierella ambigua]|nr:hypothetical protein DFQ26_004439 [Actinomortierella ambigua]
MHGLLDNAASFDLLAPLLLEQLGPEPVEILSIDLAGHGLSSHRGTEDHSRWRYVDEADQVTTQMGLFPESIGPYTLPIEEQPQRLLKFLAAKKTLSTKRDAFFPTIQAAVRARTLGSKDSVWPIREDVAAVFIPRSLKPTEQKDEHTQTTQQGYSWCWDRMIMISDVMANSDLYTKAFVSRVTCPVLFILAIDGYAWKREKDGKVMSWFTASSSVTVRDVEGGHHVHIEDAPMTARLITEWLLEQESSMKARL